LKKAKLVQEIGLMDHLKNDPQSIVAFYGITGNIKNPIFEGIPSLTPEWLLKKVWLKVNGDTEQSVLASMISKDMGPKLRAEIRTYLEKREEVQQGNRINLKGTIMQAIEATIMYQKDKPMLVILRDSKIKSKKEGKGEKNFSVALTPYGQSVCSTELQLKKRDSFIQRTSSSGTPLKSADASLASLVAPTGGPSSPSSIQLDQTKWRLPENFKEVEDELLKKNVQVGDLSSQLINMKDDLSKRDLMIMQLRTIILELKPNHPLPDLLPAVSTESVLLPSSIVEHNEQQQHHEQQQEQHEHNQPPNEEANIQHQILHTQQTPNSFYPNYYK